MLGFKRKCKTYDSIHNLPMSVYNSINEGNDYSLLSYGCNWFPTVHEETNFEDVWAKIYEEDEEVFGGNKEWKKWIDLKIDEIELLEDCYTNDNRMSRTFANIKAHEADKLVQSLSNHKFEDLYKALMKDIGPFDLRTTTVYTFKTMLHGKV